MSGNVTEHALWQTINGLGWWWWGAIAVMAACNAFNIYRLAPVKTMYGRLIRVTALLGFLLISLSPLNTAFGPCGLPLVLLAFMGMTHQMYRQCRAEGRIPRKVEGHLGVKLAAVIVEPK